MTNDNAGVFDIFDPVDSIADGLRHYYVPISPAQTQDTTGYDKTGTVFRFVTPNCICFPEDTFVTIDGALTQAGAAIGAYDPAVVATHCTVQNSAMSFFTQAEMKHNGTAADTVTNPGACQTVDWVMTPKDVCENQAPNDFTYLKRADTFEGAAGRKYMTDDGVVMIATAGTASGGFTPITLKATDATVTATVAAINASTITTTDNASTYDPSFEARCRITGKSEFQISGKLPFMMTKYRSKCVALNKSEINLTRAEDVEILENRSGVTTKLSTKNITVWLHCAEPSIEKMSSIMAGIDNGSEQKIGGKRFVYTYVNIAKDLAKVPYRESLKTRPSKIFVGFRTMTQVSTRTWNHQDIKSVSCRFNNQLVNDASLEVTDWTSKKDARALYEHYVSATGQGGFGGIPCLTFNEFTENYCLWSFDCSTSMTGMLELATKPGQLDIEVKFISGKAANAMIMDAFIVYDSLYSIKGPQDTLTSYY